jgi:hypothetical protein
MRNVYELNTHQKAAAVAVTVKSIPEGLSCEVLLSTGTGGLLVVPIFG